MQGHAGGYLAADNFCKRNLAEEGVRQSLKDEQHRFVVRIRFDDHRLLVFVLRAITFDGRIRHEFDDFLQNFFDTFAGQRGALEHRYDITLQDTLGQALAELLVRKSSLVEVDIHQFFVNFRDRFCHRVLVLQRDDRVAELVLQLLDRRCHINVFFIYLIENNKFRRSDLFACVPCFLCSYLYARGSVHHDSRCFHASERALYFARKVEESRSINKVDLDIVVFYRY